MPEPISLIAFTAVGLSGAAGLRDISNRRSGFSDYANFLAREAKTLVEKNDRSLAMIGHRSAVLSALMDLKNEHSHRGWDGADAPPISPVALDQARDLIMALPPSIPNPELAVDPDDGAVSLEWYAGPSRIFSVSIGNSPRMACAGLDGTDSWHGVARFDGVKLPEFVWQGIQRVCA
ncbi:MAG: hypothetical protein K9M97_12545 [Akkermansiaceae bacterium]|nr:hypothetical protein [Akkermansiaceae bacterium]